MGTKVIAILSSYTLRYYRDVLRGIKTYALTRPDWVLARFPPSAANLRAVRQLRPGGIIAQISSERMAKALLALRCPLVDTGDLLRHPRIAWAGNDNRPVGRTAAEHLLQRGLRQFAFVGHPNNVYSTGREAGFREVIERAGFSVNLYHERDERRDPAGEFRALDRRLRRWISSLPRPVGLFTCNDQWGVQVTEACRQLQLRVPDDVAIIGADNDDLLCELATPSLSSVITAAEQIGHEAAAMLDRLIARKPVLHERLIGPLGVATRQSSELLAIQDRDVADAVRYIRAHSHEPIKVKEILKQVPISRRSLEQRFKRVLQRSIWEEIRRVHMERACELLTRTDLSLVEVALRSGFSSSSQFATVFREEMHQTPRAFRRQFRKT